MNSFDLILNLDYIKEPYPVVSFSLIVESSLNSCFEGSNKELAYLKTQILMYNSRKN